MANGIPLSLTDAAQRPLVLLSVGDSLSLGCTDVASQVIRTAIPIHLADVIASLTPSYLGESIVLAGNESSTVFIAGISVTDTWNIGLSDGQESIPSIIQTVESCSVACSEVATVNTSVSSVQFIAALDSCVAGISEAPSSSIGLSPFDSISTSIDAGIFGEETSIFGFTPQQFVTVSVIDTCVVEVLTYPFPVTPIYATDTCFIQVVEPQDSSQTIQPTDSVGITSSEVTPSITFTASQLQLSASETLTVAASDQVPILTSVTWSISDNLQVSCDEQALSGVLVVTTELLSITCLELPGITTTFSSVETLTLGTTDASIVLRMSSTSDVNLVQASEIASLFIAFNFNASDSMSVGLTDVITSVQVSGAADVVTVGLSDAGPFISVVAIASESLSISLNEASLLFLRFLGMTDSLGITATEAVSVFSNFIQQAVTDSLKIGATDTAQAPSINTPIQVAESLLLALSDVTSQIMLSPSGEPVILGASDVADILSTLQVQDDLTYTIASEDANIINPFVVNVFISVEDTLIGIATEATGSLPTLLTVYADDTIGMPIDDVALKDIIPLLETLDFEIPTSYQAVSDPQSFQTVSSNFW